MISNTKARTKAYLLALAIRNRGWCRHTGRPSNGEMAEKFLVRGPDGGFVYDSEVVDTAPTHIPALVHIIGE